MIDLWPQFMPPTTIKHVRQIRRCKRHILIWPQKAKQKMKFEKLDHKIRSIKNLIFICVVSPRGSVPAGAERLYQEGSVSALLPGAPF